MSDDKPRFEVVEIRRLVDRQTGEEFHFDDDGDLAGSGVANGFIVKAALTHVARFILAELNDNNEPSPYGHPIN